MTNKTAGLTGHSLVAGQSLPGTAGEAHGYDPTTGQPLDPGYSMLGMDQLDDVASAAQEAFETMKVLAPEKHAALLDSIAEHIAARGDEVIARAMLETGLPEARLRGELARTTNQLKLFATVVRAGHHRGVRIDPAMPDRTPLPRPDIRQRKIPMGPVVVFGASNFPLAFSTAGGDTAAALAAGCPVVFKAHNSHPGTGELVGRAILAAIAEQGLPPGIFSLVYGSGSSVGQGLVAHPTFKAVGFTGSREAGMALMRTAAARPQPIPVYAEMSSVNPVFMFEGLLGDASTDLDELAQAFVTSATASAGQLCTQPGLVFVPRGAEGDAFLDAVQGLVSGQSGQTMLSDGIATSWREGVSALDEQNGVQLLAAGEPGAGPNAPAPVIYVTSVDEFVANDTLQDEIFGAASLMIRYESVSELVECISGMEGQLTASLHLAESDHAQAQPLIPLLEEKVGRILVNGWPTGVEVGHAMVHGGPFPATSDGRTTSVGTLAIDRFLRPVAYQGFPSGLLPVEMRDDNPWELTRLVDGSPDVPAASR